MTEREDLVPRLKLARHRGPVTGLRAALLCEGRVGEALRVPLDSAASVHASLRGEVSKGVSSTHVRKSNACAYLNQQARPRVRQHP